MKILVKKVFVIDIQSEHHHQIVDILIDNGIIARIAENIENSNIDSVIEIPNLHVSQGWFDSSVCFGEPGFEERETIANGLNVAARSGFTAVCVQPNTNPVIDNQAQIQFLKSKSAGFATDLYPIGAFTKNSDGKDMAELFDMKNAGAIAFGDYNKNIDNANLVKIGLQYLQDFDGLMIAFCENKDIKANGIVNESATTMHFGLKVNSILAEEMELARNLFLLEYAGGRLHIPTISTAKSVTLIREAKAKGLKVSCSVAVPHLILTDSCLETFDTRFKTVPPLRTLSDCKALIDGVLDKTIDMITSDHNPIDIDHKNLEFDMAKNGTTGLESAFGALMNVLPIDIIIEKLTTSKLIFGIPNFPIVEKQVANLAFFSLSEHYTFNEKHIFSKSKNSAFIGMEIGGKVHGIFNNNQLILNNI